MRLTSHPGWKAFRQLLFTPHCVRTVIIGTVTFADFEVIGEEAAVFTIPRYSVGIQIPENGLMCFMEASLDLRQKPPLPFPLLSIAL